MSRLLCFLFLFSLCGCVTGFDRTMVRDQLRFAPGEGAKAVQHVSAEKFAQVMALRPQLRFPCNVAVYMCPGDGYGWCWTAEDKKVLDAWGKALRQEGVVANMFLMSEMFVQGQDLEAIRLAAASYGADAVLVIKGATQTNEYQNPAALLNLTIVGGFIVPASHADSLFVAQAGLIDVANGFVYASMEGEGKGYAIGPTFIIDEKASITRAKRQAIRHLAPEIYTRLRRLRDAYSLPPLTAQTAAQTNQPDNPPTLGQATSLKMR